MGRKYAAVNSVTNTANLPIISLSGSAAVRPKVFEVDLGSRAAPVDQNAAYELSAITAAGDRTALTAAKLDSGDPAALSTARGQAGGTTDPTFGADKFLLFGMNQRAPFRWVAAPECGILLPIGTANGIGLRSPASSAAFVADATMQWEE